MRPLQSSVQHFKHPPPVTQFPISENVISLGSTEKKAKKVTRKSTSPGVLLAWSVKDLQHHLACVECFLWVKTSEVPMRALNYPPMLFNTDRSLANPGKCIG